MERCLQCFCVLRSLISCNGRLAALSVLAGVNARTSTLKLGCFVSALKVEVGGAVPCYYLLRARRTIGAVGEKAETLGHAHIEAKGRIAAKVAFAIEMMIKVFKGRN